ncbi:MAG: TetR/AcrR family transcriptional regulator [Stackebrandtia sp.]
MADTTTGQRAERADAARNRRVILAATQELLDRHGAGHVSLDRVARLAGVGKGTVFRRFGNRTGLFQSLLEEQAESIRHGIETGPPPLGPGAPPRQRLLAFVTELAGLSTSNLELKDAHDRSCAENVHDSPTYKRWHTHVRALIEECRPDIEAGFTAHVMLGAFHADLVRHTVVTSGVPQFIRDVRQLADSLTAERRDGRDGDDRYGRQRSR